MWAVISPNSRHFQKRYSKRFAEMPFVPVSRDPKCGVSLKEALAHERVTDVYVCVPTMLTGPIVVECLIVGKNVLVEKGWYGVDPKLPLDIAEQNGLKLDLAAQSRYAENRPAYDLQFDMSRMIFEMPIPVFPQVFEDVGFYPVLEMLLHDPDAKILDISKYPGPKWRAEFSTPTRHHWILDFAVDKAFFQASSFFRNRRFVGGCHEPFVSQDKPARYHKCIMHFEESTGISPAALVWPKLAQILKEWKEHVGTPA